MHSPDELLVRLLRPACGDDVRAIGPETWTIIAELARTHRVAGLLLHRLRERGHEGVLPAPARDTLERHERESAIRVLYLQGAFLELASRLAAASIPVIALKGLHLGATVYPAPGMRSMEDIDVLVSREDALRARATALSLGYSAPGTSAEVDLATQHHFATLCKPKVNLEIHWRMTPMSLGPDVDIRGVTARVRRFRMGQQDVLGLSPPDLVLHLCAHTAYQHLFEQRMGSLWDLAFTIATHRAECHWDTIADRARAWGIARGTSLTLRLAVDLAGADIPLAAIDERLGVSPSAEAVDAARAQIFRPKETLPFSHHLTRIMDSEVPARDRLKLLTDRAFLTGSALTDPAAAKTARHVAFRLWRSARLALMYSGRLSRQILRRRPEFRDIAARRNAVARWLDPPN